MLTDMARQFYLTLIISSLFVLSVHGNMFNRWSIAHAKELGFSFYNEETNKNWARLTISSFGEQRRRVGHFRFRISPKIVIQDLQIDIDLTSMGNRSLSEITKRMNEFVGDLKMKYEGVRINIKSEEGTLVIRSKSLDDVENDGVYKLVLKGAVEIEQGDDVIKGIDQLWIYRDVSKTELVIEYG